MANAPWPASADLISEGNMGMMHAVKKFEPEDFACHLCDAVDQGGDPRIHTALKLGKNRHNRAKKLFFNFAGSRARFRPSTR